MYRSIRRQHYEFQVLKGKTVRFVLFRVDIIGTKNSELNHMEARMKLMSSGIPVRSGGGNSTVSVFVTKAKQPTVSEKTEVKH